LSGSILLPADYSPARLFLLSTFYIRDRLGNRVRDLFRDAASEAVGSKHELAASALAKPGCGLVQWRLEAAVVG
jgi:hypothetical protein